jgi:hypothetical protein
MSNKNMHVARRVKNDEFYTLLPDIEKELQHYADLFEGCVVYANCDGPDSNFVKHFKTMPYRIKEFLHSGTDFRGQPSIELLQQADIVVTNPPFSLFREYIEQLMQYDKKFLIIGNMNAITYKEVFRHIQDNKLWLGNAHPKAFVQPDGSLKKFGNICWYTNLPTRKSNELVLTKRYYGNEHLYPRYDNYDAINVDKAVDIPMDYPGVMGVPISFLDKYNPQQFEIVGYHNGGNKNFTIAGKYHYGRIHVRNPYQFEIIRLRKGDDGKDLSVNGVCPYARICIRNRNPETDDARP